MCTLQCLFCFSKSGFVFMFSKCSCHLQKYGNLYHLKLVALETGYNFLQFHSKNCWTPRQKSIAALFTCFPRPINLPQEWQIIFLFLAHSGRPTPERAYNWLEKTLKSCNIFHKKKLKYKIFHRPEQYQTSSWVSEGSYRGDL